MRTATTVRSTCIQDGRIPEDEMVLFIRVSSRASSGFLIFSLDDAAGECLAPSTAAVDLAEYRYRLNLAAQLTFIF